MLSARPEPPRDGRCTGPQLRGSDLRLRGHRCLADLIDADLGERLVAVPLDLSAAKEVLEKAVRPIHNVEQRLRDVEPIYPQRCCGPTLIPDVQRAAVARVT